MLQARTIAEIPDAVDELEEPVITELSIWRAALTPNIPTHQEAARWQLQLRAVDSRDLHLRAFVQRLAGVSASSPNAAPVLPLRW